MKIFVVVPDILNNGGIKTAANWVRFLIDHKYDAILANGGGKPSAEWWNFKVPTCNFAQIEDAPENKAVYNWGPDIINTSRLQQIQKYYYAQDCAQPFYPAHEQFLPLMLKMKFGTIGHHSHWYYLYNYKIQSKIVNNFTDQEVFYPGEKVPNRLCMILHREHYSGGVEQNLKTIGYDVVVASGSQEDVASAMRTSTFFLSMAPGVYDGYEMSEGFPLPIAEAMSCGCVVLCRDSNGVNEYMMDKVNGFFHDGSFGRIADRMGRVYKDKEYMKWISDNAYKTFKYRFNIANTWEQMKAFLEI